MALWDHYLGLLWHLLGCRVFEDMSAICGAIGWGVPW